MIKPIDSSPEALSRIIPGTVDNVGTGVNAREKYPYSELTIGQSFTLPLEVVTNEHSLRNIVAAKAKTTKKKFTVIKHGEPYLCYEIARIG